TKSTADGFAEVLGLVRSAGFVGVLGTTDATGVAELPKVRACRLEPIGDCSVDPPSEQPPIAAAMRIGSSEAPLELSCLNIIAYLSRP
ncbi:MAG TPA: hypothetical protein VIV60_31705, partial [Polyangiaceae bacterium]